MKKPTDMTARAEDAARLYREADRLDRQRPVDFCSRVLSPLAAEQKRAQAEVLLDIAPESVAGNNLTEMVTRPDADELWTAERTTMVDTLTEPNAIGVAASEHRAGLATRAGVLAPALDAVLTAGASNSLEKMLCHQLAAVHAAAMDLLAEVYRMELPSDRARVLASVARLFETYQTGCLALQRLKMRGRQHVVVQYQQVNVAAGGQAMVTGQVRGRRRGGRGPKKSG